MSKKKSRPASSYEHVLKEFEKMKRELTGGMSYNLRQCEGECEELFMLGLMREFNGTIFVDNMTNIPFGDFSIHVEVNPTYPDGTYHGFEFILQGDLSGKMTSSALFVMFDNNNPDGSLNLDPYKEEHMLVAKHEMPLIHFSLDDLRVFNAHCVRETIKVLQSMWCREAYESTKSKEFLEFAYDLWS